MCSLPTYVRWKERGYLICKLGIFNKTFQYQSSPAMSPSACALLCLTTASPSPNKPRSVPAIPADRDRGGVLHTLWLKLCTVKGALRHRPWYSVQWTVVSTTNFLPTEGMHVTSLAGNFYIFRTRPHMSRHLEGHWIGKLYGKVYSTSSLWGTEHTFSFSFILCRELATTVTYLYKKGMLLVGSLLAWTVQYTST